MDDAHAAYPVTLEIDYPDRELDRLSTLLRPLAVLPVAILLAFVSGSATHAALTRFGLRVTAYAALLRDEYPSTDDEQAVHLTLPYPDARRELNRWLPLFKWILAVPHYLVLAVLCVGAVFSVIFAWFAILFTGRYPRALFEYVVGVLRWWVRVAAYAFLLTTDRYPPFRLAD